MEIILLFKNLVSCKQLLVFYLINKHFYVKAIKEKQAKKRKAVKEQKDTNRGIKVSKS